MRGFMERYDDFAVNLNSFETMAKEYNAQIQSKMLKVDIKQVNLKLAKSLFNKIEYLRVLVNDLKQRTSNSEILIVLDDVLKQIENQNQILSTLFEQGIEAQTQSEDSFKMFCNNLKLSISTTSDIIKLLIEIKDDEETSFEAKSKLTEVINSFLDINNNLVSLFGECRYLRY